MRALSRAAASLARRHREKAEGGPGAPLRDRGETRSALASGRLPPSARLPARRGLLATAVPVLRAAVFFLAAVFLRAARLAGGRLLPGDARSSCVPRSSCARPSSSCAAAFLRAAGLLARGGLLASRGLLASGRLAGRGLLPSGLPSRGLLAVDRLRAAVFLAAGLRAASSWLLPCLLPFPCCLVGVRRTVVGRSSGRHALQASALPFAHAPPHAVSLVTTEGVVQALDADGTLAADPLGLPR